MKRLVPCVAVLLLVSGCFVTTLDLGSPADAKVDPNYCGNWHMTWKADAADQSADMLVRNFDGKQYYVQWKEGGEQPVHMNGFIVTLKDATFIQCSELTSTNDLSNRHLVARVKLDGRKLILHHLKEDFFEGVTTDAELRKMIEENIENEAMYDELVTGSQVAQR